MTKTLHLASGSKVLRPAEAESDAQMLEGGWKVQQQAGRVIDGEDSVAVPERQRCSVAALHEMAKEAEGASVEAREPLGRGVEGR